MTKEIIELAAIYAAEHSLDPDIVRAVISVESNGDPFAWNPEPKYRYLWDVRRGTPFRKLTVTESASEVPPNDFPFMAGDRDQEWWGQQASWGLMQVMGAVAREQGFGWPYLTKLVDPAVNLDIGCGFLRRLFEGNPTLGITRALAIYNGGPVGNQVPPYRNVAYVQKVMAARL